MATVEDKWAGTHAAQHYAGPRFATSRAARRDPRLVRALLARHAPAAVSVLDAPCGSGRLTPALAGRQLTRLDANHPMLLSAREQHGPAAELQASVAALPLGDASFDAVVCCRLLHHLRTEAELERAVSELVRVTRDVVVASFWDAASLPGLRLRLGLKRDEGPRGRVFTSRAHLAELFHRAGAPVVEFRGVLRFVTQQTFLVARRSVRP